MKYGDMLPLLPLYNNVSEAYQQNLLVWCLLLLKLAGKYTISVIRLQTHMIRSCHDTLIGLMHTIHVFVPMWPPLRVEGLTAIRSSLDLHHQQTQPGNSLWKVVYVNGLLMNITLSQSCLGALDRTVFSIMYIDFSTSNNGSAEFQPNTPLFRLFKKYIKISEFLVYHNVEVQFFVLWEQLYKH